jgi:hypothetical protein
MIKKKWFARLAVERESMSLKKQTSIIMVVLAVMVVLAATRK